MTVCGIVYVEKRVLKSEAGLPQGMVSIVLRSRSQSQGRGYRCTQNAVHADIRADWCETSGSQRQGGSQKLLGTCRLGRPFGKTNDGFDLALSRQFIFASNVRVFVCEQGLIHFLCTADVRLLHETTNYSRSKFIARQHLSIGCKPTEKQLNSQHSRGHAKLGKQPRDLRDLRIDRLFRSANGES